MCAAPLGEGDFLGRKSAVLPGSPFASMIVMLHMTERLWSLGDGTTCVLDECDGPPRYEISILRDSKVLRQRRLYGKASAQVLAEDWRYQCAMRLGEATKLYR